jgi:hypothetical protein
MPTEAYFTEPGFSFEAAMTSANVLKGRSDEEDGHQIVFNVERRFLENSGNNGVRIECHEKRSSVRRAFGHLCGTERTGRTRPVLHDDSAIELRLHGGLEDARQRIRGTSRRKRNDERGRRRLTKRRHGSESG